jgi:DNA-binding XRE family transcriptional regulator
MNAADYKTQRKLRGTQIEVAELLEVYQQTISRREAGTAPVTREAWLALLSLPKKKKAKNEVQL